MAGKKKKKKTRDGSAKPVAPAREPTARSKFWNAVFSYLARFDLQGQLLEKLSPVQMALAVAALGGVMALASIVVGVAKFGVTANFTTPGGPLTRSFELGYMDQLSYGWWFIAGAPLLFGAGCYATKYGTPRSSAPPVEGLAKHPGLRVVFAFVTLLTIAMSVGLELRDFKSIGLGWVQAPHISEDARALETPGYGPRRLTRQFDIVNDAGVGFVHASEATIVEVRPARLSCRRGAAFIAFVVVAKSMVGFQDALLLRLTILFAWWAYRVRRTITVESIRSARDGRYGIGWVAAPSLGFIWTMVAGAFFMLLRISSNLAKGSFGGWAHELALAIYVGLPVSLILIALVLYMARVHALEVHSFSIRNDHFWSIGHIAGAGVLTTVVLSVLGLLLGYEKNTDNSLAVEIVKVINVTSATAAPPRSAAPAEIVPRDGGR